MFDYLARFSVILVTGPQRSGTTICARMIEHDLGYKYLDEGRWKVWNGMDAFQQSRIHIPCVLQGPGLLKDVGRFGQMDDTAVVVMRRELKHILASQERVNWNVWAAKEISHYNITPGSPADLEPAQWVAWVKYNWWERIGRSQVKHPYEVEYEDLRLHSMWVDKDGRSEFGARQYRR
jgi:hypothetical protein